MNTTCPICEKNYKSFTPWLYHCPACDFYHSTLKASPGVDVTKGLKNLRIHNFKKIIRLIEKHHIRNEGELLEIGCAKGWFLDIAKAHGLICQGIEPCEKSAEICLKKNHNVIQACFPHAENQLTQTFDLIIFNDVFEHINYPSAVLTSCERLLKPGGHLILNIPSSGGLFYKIARLIYQWGFKRPFERLWQKNFSSPHVSYFNQKNLQQLATSHTNLKCTYSTYLSPIQFSETYQRLRIDQGRLTAILMYIGIALFYPFLWLLPKDIMLLIFQKPKH